MKIIKLTKGMITQVDDADYEQYGHLKWRALNGRYAYRQEPPWDRPTPVLLHRLIAGAEPGQHVHHVDGDKLNNQRANLQLMAGSEHRSFHERTSGPTSGQYKGVSWNARRNAWLAQMGTSEGHLFLGHFDTALKAARAYDVAALNLWGLEAYLNFPCLKWSPPPMKRVIRCKGYRGVSWSKQIQRWVVFFQWSGLKCYLGCYQSAQEAAMAYDRAATKAMGDRSIGVLNFPCLIWMYQRE